MNIKVGQTFKNYKEMCTELGWEIKSSTNSKNAQYKELSRFCNYSKIGHKITIEEVYDTPLPRNDKRGENNNIYGNLIQLLITDLLAQCDGHISISRSKLMNTIGMVNCNYSECRELVQKLATYTEIDERIIYDFYNTSTSSFKSVIETSLNSLMDKRVIMYNKIIKITEKDEYAPRTATERELQMIMKIEKDTLEHLGYKQISSVRMSKDWKKFKEKVNKLLHDQSNINFYFTAYDITIHEEYIVKERNELVNLLLEQIRRQDSKNELNKLVFVQLMMNAQKRHEKAFTSKKMGKVRMNKSYIEDFERLANLLIDKNTPNILHKIRSIEIEQDIFTPELIAEIEELLG